MLLRVPLIIFVALITGCSTKTSFPELRIPSKESNHYAAPDGREWVPLPSNSSEGTLHSLEFVPSETSMTNWTEKIGFTTGKGRMTHAEVQRMMVIALEIDPELVYSIEDKNDSMFVMTYSSPKWNEQGITKQIVTESGYCSVSYTTRRGKPGLKRFGQWTLIIENAILNPDKFP